LLNTEAGTHLAKPAIFSTSKHCNRAATRTLLLA
jgi:hypothetical protein